MWRKELEFYSSVLFSLIHIKFRFLFGLVDQNNIAVLVLQVFDVCGGEDIVLLKLGFGGMGDVEVVGN